MIDVKNNALTLLGLLPLSVRSQVFRRGLALH